MKLSVQAVIEVLGRPPEHLTDALNQLIVSIGAEKGLVVREKLVHEPTKAEGSDDLFTNFAELTLDCDSMDSYFLFVFRYMPSHIEIISPENLHLTNLEFTELANRISSRMHEYDALAKKALFERNLFMNKLKEVSPEALQSLMQAPQDSSSQAQTPSKAVKKNSKKPAKSKKRK